MYISFFFYYQVFDSPLFDNESEGPTIEYQEKVYKVIKAQEDVSKKTQDIYEMRHRQGNKNLLMLSISGVKLNLFLF